MQLDCGPFWLERRQLQHLKRGSQTISEANFLEALSASAQL